MDTLKVVEGRFGVQPPKGLAQNLRDMADAADRGDLTEIAAVTVQDGNYVFTWGTSLIHGIALTAMLHSQAIDRMRTPTGG